MASAPVAATGAGGGGGGGGACVVPIIGGGSGIVVWSDVACFDLHAATATTITAKIIDFSFILFVFVFQKKISYSIHAW
jgi:hypothetical protein